mgnify:CR=1 FL=1
MIKVMTVFGTRPEAIKMCPLVKELESREEIQSLVCVTAQHRQMLDQVLKLFAVTPDYDLNIMRDRQTLTGITVRALEGLEQVLEEAKPDLVLVHGDTTTTFAGSLAAYYHQIAVGHVEAGLRTYQKYFPFPEEMNRRMTGAIADLHFSPTVSNRENLLRENVSEDQIFITGNTAIDALKTTVREDYQFQTPALQTVDFSRRVIVMTAHRRENLGKPLEQICRAVLRVAKEFPDVTVIYPVHLNPRVRETAFSILGRQENIMLIDPLDVEELHNLMARCCFLLTDSGGIQEEAPALGKPVLVLRNETERPEAVAAGTVRIAGCNEEQVYQMTVQLLEDQESYQAMSHAVNPYGDGTASRRIADAILYHFGKAQRPEDFQA